MTRNIRKKKKGKENNFNNSCNENELVQIVAIDDNNLNCNNQQHYEGASGGCDVIEEEELPIPGSSTAFDHVNFGYIDDDTAELVPEDDDNASEKAYEPLYAEVEYGWGCERAHGSNGEHLDEDDDDYDLGLWDDDESWEGDTICIINYYLTVF